MFKELHNIKDIISKRHPRMPYIITIKIRHYYFGSESKISFICHLTFGKSSLTVFQMVFVLIPKYSCIITSRKPDISFQGISLFCSLIFNGIFFAASPITLSRLNTASCTSLSISKLFFCETFCIIFDQFDTFQNII